MSASVLYEFAEDILDFVYAQMSNSTLNVPCNKYVYVCEPDPSPCCDYLAIFIDNIGATETSFSKFSEFDPFTVTASFRFKLMRRDSEKRTSMCAPSATVTPGLYQDAVVLRSAIIRFFNEGNNSDKYVPSLNVMIPVCGETEYCSGWTVGLDVKMYVCDDGFFTGVVTLPTRCTDDGDTTGDLTDSGPEGDQAVLEQYR